MSVADELVIAYLQQMKMSTVSMPRMEQKSRTQFKPKANMATSKCQLVVTVIIPNFTTLSDIYTSIHEAMWTSLALICVQYSVVHRRGYLPNDVIWS